MTTDIKPLFYISRAPSKKFIDQVFIRLYQTRNDGILPSFVSGVAQQLKHEDIPNETEHVENTKVMLQSILYVIRQAVYHQVSNEQQVLQQIFANTAQEDAQLKQYIAQVLVNNVPMWSEQAAETQVSLPKLIDMKWRVDIKSASHVISQMQQPCVMVHLETQQLPAKKGFMQPTASVDFEMNKETLEVMLKGLGKIRDQLSSIKQ